MYCYDEINISSDCFLLPVCEIGENIGFNLNSTSCDVGILEADPTKKFDNFGRNQFA
jgi:hypothetical protein